MILISFLLSYFLIWLIGFLIWTANGNKIFGWVFVTTSALPFGIAGLLVIALTISWIDSPTQPSKSDIIGHYEIDRSRYPGPEADWQHTHYSMEITAQEVVLRDHHLNQVWRGDIKWFIQPDYRWKFKSLEKRHHLVVDGPALYRNRFNYYYVFKSRHYGDVFFVKK